MIVAAGLTPAWQQMLLLDGLRVGEVNRAREAHWCSSGKVLNVGIALHTLGGPSCTVALVGGNPGHNIDRELQGLGVPRTLVWSKSPTRCCTTILDQASGVTTELVENAGPVTPEELDAYFSAFEQAARGAELCVLSGSLPAGAPHTFYRDLMGLARGRIVLDVRGSELLEALPLGPYCVKPNREELEKTFGRKLSSDAELGDAMREVLRLGAQSIVVSAGKDRLWAMTSSGLHSLRPARVPTVNPIGCGDCLAAGIAWATRRGDGILDAIRFGMAAAAENASMLLPSRLELGRVTRLADQVALEG